MNLPVPYDPVFAACQQPDPVVSWEVGGVIYTQRIDDVFDELVSPITGRPMYFDRQGTPITMMQWGELREIGLDPGGAYGEDSYVRIGRDKVGDAEVSTVWLGIDHGWGFDRDEPYQPVIFESMIFGGRYDTWQMRYCTEWEAIKGHAEAVTDLKAGMQPWWAYGGQEDDEWHMEGERGGQKDT